MLAAGLALALTDCDGPSAPLDPNGPAIHNNRGYAWYLKKDYDKAIGEYDEALRLNPRLAAVYSNRGLALSNKMDLDKAMDDFNEAIRLDPRLARAYNNRGVVWRENGEYDKAIGDYSEAIRLDPTLVAVYHNRGLAWNDKMDYGKAIGDYSEAIRLDPRDADGYIARAWIWATAPDEKVRDGKQAVESATRACELNEWKSPEWLDTLAAAYAEAGDFDAAVTWQEKAIGLIDAKDEAEIADYRSRLNLYRDKKPYHQESRP